MHKTSGACICLDESVPFSGGGGFSKELNLDRCHPGFAAGIRRLVELHLKKGSDYGTAEDIFANVRRAERWGIPPWIGVMNRAEDKIQRLQTYANKGTLKNESVVDSFEDLANYTLIARALFLEKEGKPDTLIIAEKEREA